MTQHALYEQRLVDAERYTRLIEYIRAITEALDLARLAGYERRSFAVDGVMHREAKQLLAEAAS